MNIKISYLVERPSGFYFNVTKRMREAGVESEALGKDPAKAKARAIELNEIWREIRTAQSDPGTAPAGTVRWLIGEFQAADEYRDLRDTTKIHDYDPALRKIEAGFGLRLLAAISPKVCKIWYRTLRATGHQHGANNTFKVFRRLLSYAVSEDLRESNPAAAVRMKGAPARRVVWEYQQVAAFAEKASELGRPSMALSVWLCFELCQNPTDIINLKRNAYDGQVIRLARSKTGAPALIPLHAAPHLREMLDQAKEGAVASTHLVVNETTGRPYSAGRWGHIFSDIRAATGLPKRLQARDLRRSGATEAAEAGATDDEIRAVTAHLTREVVSRYVDPFRGGSMAGSAMAKRAAHRTKTARK